MITYIQFLKRIKVNKLSRHSLKKLKGAHINKVFYVGMPDGQHQIKGDQKVDYKHSEGQQLTPQHQAQRQNDRLFD